MGIRAVGFLKPGDYGDDASKYLNKFREYLFQLGAFGFETWTCKIFSKKQDANLTRLIQFNDTPDQNILISNILTLVGDANFPSVLSDIGLAFDKKTLIFKIDGSMAQLGDFKVRYGIAIAKEKQVGILFDIEYLPVTKLSVNPELIFSSVCKTMDLQIKLYTPQSSPTEEYSFTCLGQDYLKVLLDNEIIQ